jgi:hypothetical protein
LPLFLILLPLVVCLRLPPLVVSLMNVESVYLHVSLCVHVFVCVIHVSDFG